MTNKKSRLLVLLAMMGLFAAVCATGCSSDKTYSANSSESGKAPAASAPPAAPAADAPRAKPGSEEAGGK